MDDQPEQPQQTSVKPRRGKPIASRLLIVALNLVNEKMGQIRAAGFSSYMNEDLPNLRDAIVGTLKQRGEWDGDAE